MAHQINLYSPVLLAPRRHFAAASMVRALLVLAIGLAALALWTDARSRLLQRELAAAAALHAAEQARLQASLERLKASALPTSTAALEQELARESTLLLERRARRAELERGLQVDGGAPSALLRRLAQGLPAAVWLDDVHYIDGRLAIGGFTREPESLRPWIGRLAGERAEAGTPLVLHRVERVAAGDGAPTWSFRIGPAVAVAANGAANGGAK
jgi:Tfp pilus assembly protein PilN